MREVESGMHDNVVVDGQGWDGIEMDPLPEETVPGDDYLTYEF
jgi:hypothetical protein